MLTPLRFLLPLCLMLITLGSTACASTSTGSTNPAGYLFATFKGEQSPMTEQVYFSLSEDGRNWTALNGGEPVLVSKLGEKGVRDPYLIRSYDNTKFYLIATDLSINRNGNWGRAVRNGSHALIIWESADLVNWSEPRRVEVAAEDAGNTWAPEAIYDAEAGNYLVFWASTTARDDNKKQRIWAARTEDFKTFSEPFIYIDYPHHVIDTTIVQEDGQYYRFNKDEQYKAITMETAPSLDGPWSAVPGFTLNHLQGFEGPQCYRIEAATAEKPATWCLIIDHYAKGKGYKPFITNDLSSGHFEPAKGFDFPFKHRHGSVLPLTQGELNRLATKWAPSDFGRADATPVEGNNPVLDGYYADPDVLYSEKTGLFYIYPTSDGFPGWSGKYFKTFSSPNLVDWKDEGVILDLKTDVSWADRNAWAPCIIERKIDGQYKYFYYFTAAQKVGVAVADHPTGPFVDSGKALIDRRPPGVNGGQQIDPEVFHDPQGDKYYLYWGNGYMAAAELNDDMISIKEDTLKVMTPDATFREGVTVFFREGTYYFLWSEDDTRSPNYRVRYATAPSPMGPLTIPEGNLVIEKDPDAGIYGTGHNSVLQVPGRDEWYIVYHRFNYPDGIHMGGDAGFHREVCIDPMKFDEDGSIRRITPTHTGIQPVRVAR